MTSATFRVPAALDAAGALTTPNRAIQGKEYTCPACGDSLVFRVGTIRTPHFAHRPASHCSVETVTHQIAKLLVQQAMQDWHAGRAPAPQLVRCCSVCRIP